MYRSKLTLLALMALLLCGMCITDVKVKTEYFLLNFTAPAWCGPCQQMEREVWPDKTVQAVIKARPYELYHLDMDDTKNSKFFKAYGVKSVPTIILVRREGETVTILDRKSGVQTPALFAGWLEKTK
jgi:thiol:disulfide interchange protein